MRLNNLPLHYIPHTYLIFFVYSSLDEHLGCFHTLAIVNCAPRNMRVLMPLLVPDFNLPRNGIATSQGVVTSFLPAFLEPSYSFP